MKRALPFILLFCTLVTAASSADLIAMLVGDTNDPSIGGSVKIDLRNMKAMLQDASMNAGLKYNPIEISGARLTKDSLASQCRTLEPGPDDTVIFYYSGHGYRTESKATKWPNLVFSQGREAIDMDWITKTLKAKNPRLLVVASDSCNVTFGDQYAPTEPAVRAGGDIKAGYQRLFKSTKGLILIASSIPGQPSQAYSNGGAYTLNLLASLKAEVLEEEPDWTSLLAFSVKRIDFGEGMIQDPQFELYDSAGKIISMASGDKPLQVFQAQPQRPSAQTQTPLAPTQAAAAQTTATQTQAASAPAQAASTQAQAAPQTAAAQTTATQSSGPVFREDFAGLKTDTGKSWTLLFYFMADCNLEHTMIQNAMEMAKIAKGRDLTIVFYIDRSDGYSNLSLGTIPDWIGARYILLRDGSFTALETKGRANSGNSDTLADFIAYSYLKFPADRYALFLADHGSGWKGYGGDESFKSDMLSQEELVSALSKGMKQGGTKRNLSIIGFDACLMGMYETAAAISPFADYLLASEEFVPGHGLDYSAFRIFVEKPSAPSPLLASTLVKAFKAKAEAKGTEANATLSVIALERLDSLTESFAALATKLDGIGEGSRTALGRSRARALEFGKAAQVSESFNAVDIGSLAAELAKNLPEAKDACEKVASALEECAVVNYTGSAKRGASGLSVYFPESREFLKADYLSIPSAESWLAVSKRIYGAAQAAGSTAGQGATAQPQAASAASSTASQAGGKMLAQSGGKGVFAIDQGGRPFLGANIVKERTQDIVSASLDFGFTFDGNVIFLGRLPAKYGPDKAGSFYDRRVLTVTKGAVTAYAYSAVEETDSSTVVTVPLFLYSSKTDTEPRRIRLVVTVEKDGKLVKTSFYAENPNGGLGEIYPDGKSWIRPLMFAQKAGTPRSARAWLTMKDFFPFEEGLAWRYEKLPPEEKLYLELIVKDYQGGSDFVFYSQP